MELQAHRFDSRLQTTLIGSSNEPDGIVHAYERRVRGWRTGIYDGALLLSPSASTGQTHSQLDALASTWPDVDAITLRILDTGGPTELADRSQENRLSLEQATQQYKFREVMPLADAYESFLRRLGKHTRRNIVHVQNQARRDAINFYFTTKALSVDSSILSALAKLNMPFATNPRRLLNTIQFLATKPRPFQAYLSRSADDCPFSVTGGFIDGDLALMTYQINLRRSRNLSPSLMLRSFLVQALIERGVRSLAFVGGCSGLLLHQCEVVPGAEILLVRRRLIARVKHRVCTMIAEPMSRIARLAPRYIALLCATWDLLRAL